MICNNCKKEINGEAKFCNYCGEKVIILARSNKRFLNYVIDLIGGICFIFFIGIVLGYLGIINENTSNEEAYSQVFSYGCLVFYYFIFESLFKRTPAKFITKTKVVMEDGSDPDLRHLLIRSLVRLIPFDAFSFSGHRPVGWHDRWSKTRVVEI